MPNLHETILGQKVFNSLLPRLVTALERIANSLEASSKVEMLEIALNLPSRGRVECRDGFSFTITGRDPVTDSRGLTFATQQDPLIAKYAYRQSSDKSVDDITQYRGVPPTVIATLIVKHGGPVSD